MKTAIKKVWNAVTTLLVAALVILALFLWGYRLCGMEAFVVQSGSMEPAYPVGGMVYVKPVDAEALQVGDVITFRLTGDTRGTHRIVEILEEKGQLAFRTKGDANETADTAPVTPDRILGRVCFGVPYLGFLISYIQQPPGMYTAICAVAVLLILVILPDILFDEKKMKQQEGTK